MGAAARCAILDLAAQILAWIFLKGLLTSRRAEVVRLAFVVALELGRLLIDGHLAYRIYCQFLASYVFVLYCRRYILFEQE